ncbi:protein of unknown function UPF0118 [Bradyrhizobium cosmicum]|uniref:Uncharacterized protein n=1 Tax=Bradyrhizobium cosmicum TaxID=1404864 RepID=A0AAI8MFJ4_9BRAD|nr:protein of unknown function UPF0118 [Bradyrhizobium cosmicum]
MQQSFDRFVQPSNCPKLPQAEALPVSLAKPQVSLNQTGCGHHEIIPDRAITLVQSDYDNKARRRLPTPNDDPARVYCATREATACHAKGYRDGRNPEDLMNLFDSDVLPRLCKRSSHFQD